MGILQWFKDWLTTSTRAVPAPRHPDLHPIDVAKLAEELRVKEQAQRLGTSGIPGADAEGLTGPEADIVQRVEKYRQGYLGWAVSRMNLLSCDLGKLDITAEVNRARQADKDFELRASALLTGRDSTVRSLAESARSAQKELADFRVTHGLQREARSPTGAKAFMMYSFVLLLVVIEGTVNAGFFARGLASGWLGGLTYAVGLAFLNVGIAFLWGKWAVRFMFHRRPLIKVGGFLALAMALSMVLVFGLGIAHYRDSLIAEVAEPGQAAIEALKASPFDLRDFSWVLLFISMAFGVIALGDGLATDDLYPGYGKLSRRTQDVVDDYEGELEDLREELEKLKNEGLTGLDETVEDSQSALAVFESGIDEKDSAAIRLATALHDADNSLDALLRQFRTENEYSRNGLPRPKYFDSKPALVPLPFPNFSTDADRQELTIQTALVNSLLAEVQDIRARIQKAFNDQFDLLKPLGAHYRTPEVN